MRNSTVEPQGMEKGLLRTMKVGQEVIYIIKSFHQASVILLHAPNHISIELF